MAGLGGFMGYSMGGINWDATAIGRRLGGHVKAVFTIITFIFITCVSLTITSFKEIPLWALIPAKTSVSLKDEKDHLGDGSVSYGALDETQFVGNEQPTPTVSFIYKLAKSSALRNHNFICLFYPFDSVSVD